jgi:hypothetical protein
MNRPRLLPRLLPALVLVALTCAPAATAQDAILERLPADLAVRVVMAPDQQPAHADHVVIREAGAPPQVMAERHDVRGEVVFPGVMIFNYMPYIISATVDGVTYHARHHGHAFLDGKAAVVQAFPSTAGLDGVTVEGMNVVARRKEYGLQLEYILTVDNQARPQATVRADALPVRLSLPAGLDNIVVEVDRGPDPQTAEMADTGDGWRGVAVALTPGRTRISIIGDLRGDGRADLAVAVNLPVSAWSLLAWPADQAVQSFDLRPDRDNRYAEFSRWIGEAMQPGDEVDVRIGPAATAAPVEPADVAAASAAPATPAPAGPRFPWLTLTSAVILLGAYAIWRRRR